MKNNDTTVSEIHAIDQGQKTPGAARLSALAFAALGIVYGDIGTSPLYALRECFFGSHSIAPTAPNVLGVLSLIVWALILVVSVKYLIVILRADNNGEGGIVALLALVDPWHHPNKTLAAVLIALGLFGAALLYGDSAITPAISVLSAVEGLETTNEGVHAFILPITVSVLVVLFVMQSRGTASIARVFSPIVLLWFVVLAALGIRGIAASPEVLLAVNPMHALRFFANNGPAGFVILGSVFLAVTGGEALYADMGHFGRRPIRLAWFVVALPALLLNYFGQGAWILAHEAESAHPFYDLAPAAWRIPLVVLATAATVIASQAVISGAFSLTHQAVQLRLWPPVRIVQTSSHQVGQIYVPSTNWLLMIITLGLVLGFGSSSALAAAYGIAVSGTMVITTVLAYFVARRLWRWPLPLALAVIGSLLAIDLAFLGANALKIAHGGWFPLLLAAVVYVIMSTWIRGRQLVQDRRELGAIPVEQFMARLTHEKPARVPGTAVFLTSSAQGIPAIVLHHVDRNQVLHESVVLLTVISERVPHVPKSHCVEAHQIGENLWRIVLHYGFMDSPDVPNDMKVCAEQGRLPPICAGDVTYYLGRAIMIPTTYIVGMALWRERLFAFMTRNALNATLFYRLPPERVVELGIRVEI